MNRDAGVLVLIKLVQMSAANSANGLSYADIGARFGVSRTHVRALLEDAAQHGDVSLTGRGGHLVELRPSILQAFRPVRRGRHVRARFAIQACARADE